MGTFTDNLGLYKPAVGEVGWGELVDDNFDILDSAVIDANGNPNVRFAAPWGDDANTGANWSTATATILAAYDALPSEGGRIYIANDTYVGGEVANQGIWIIGANDNLYGSPPAGWRQEKRVDFIGAGGALFSLFNRTGSVINGGQPGDGWDVTDPEKPAFWFAGVFSPISLNRIYVEDCPIALRAGVSCDESSRGAACAHLTITECGFDNGLNDTTIRTDKAPVVEFGYVFWAYFDHCFFFNQRAGRERALDFTSDTSAAVLIKPAVGQTTLAEDIDGTATEFDVVDGSAFPTGRFDARIDGLVGGVLGVNHSENMTVGSRSGNTFSAVERVGGITHETGNLVSTYPQNSAGLVHFDHIISAGGGLKYYRAPSSWSVYVDDWLQEGDFVHPIGCVVWIANADGNGSARLNDIQGADAFDNTEPIVRIGGDPPPGVIGISQTQGWIEGPHFRLPPYTDQFSPVNSLAMEGGFGFVGKRFVGRHDGAVRASGSVAPFVNLASQDVSTWSSKEGSATVTTGQRDVYGGTNAATLHTDAPATTLAENINASVTEFDVVSGSALGGPNYVIEIGSELLVVHGVSTNTLQLVSRGYAGTTPASHLSGAAVTRTQFRDFRSAYRGSAALSVGDWIVGGVWCKAESTTSIAITTEMELILTNATMDVNGSTSPTAAAFLDTLGSGEVVAGQWQFITASGKVDADLGSNEVILRLNAGVDADRTYCYPVVFQIPVGTLEDEEVAEFIYHMGTWAEAAPVGSFSTLFGQKLIAQAGLGVGNSASATTPGSVVKKMEVFDETGVSLGFVPIYSAIT